MLFFHKCSRLCNAGWIPSPLNANQAAMLPWKTHITFQELFAGPDLGKGQMDPTALDISSPTLGDLNNAVKMLLGTLKGDKS